MSRLYESEAFRGLAADGQEGDQTLPASRLSLLFEQLLTMEQEGKIAIAAIITPEHPTTGPIEVFVAPTRQDSRRPPVTVIDTFQRELLLSMRMVHSQLEEVGIAFRNDLPTNVRELVEDGAIHIPAITFTEPLNERTEEITQTRRALVRKSPILTKLGLSRLLEDSDKKTKGSSKETVNVTIVVYPSKQLAELTAKSIQRLLQKPPLFAVGIFRELITRYVPSKYLRRSRLPSPEEYLRERGILEAMEAQ